MAQTIEQIRQSLHSAAKVGWNGAIVKASARLRADAAVHESEETQAAVLRAAVLVEGMLQ